MFFTYYIGMPNSFFQSAHWFPEAFDSAPIPGLLIPEQFYWLKHSEPPLAGMQLPLPETPWEELFRHGFRWIVCLCSNQPYYNPSPLRSLVAIELCDLLEVELPEDPEKEEESIRILADAIIARLEDGEGVIVHCAGGRGRTGTVLGTVLVRLGYSPEDVVSHLDTLHRARGKEGWPESPWQRKVVIEAAQN